MVETERTVDLPPVVSEAELALNLAGVTVLDVRSPAEFAAAHIPGSHNLPLDRLGEHGADLCRQAGGPLVLVCRGGNRARQAEAALRDHDPAALHVLDGGLAAWEQSGRPVIRGRAAWSMERQVRGVAGGLVLAGALASLAVARPFAWLPAAVGGGLLFSALTDTCGMAKLLAKLPHNQGQTCDVGAVLAEIAASNPDGSQPAAQAA